MGSGTIGATTRSVGTATPRKKLGRKLPCLGVPPLSSANPSIVRRARSTARRALSEVQTHFARLGRARRRPSVVIFPGGPRKSSSSYLRAWILGDELERQGWRAIVVPDVLSFAQRQRILRLEKPDVILLQQTRHPLNRPSLYAPIPCVIDADDGDHLDPRHSARIAHWVSEAAAVVGGSRLVANWMAQRCDGPARVIWTCTPRSISQRPIVAPAQREPIVAWAHDTPLAYPHEAELMQKVFATVAQRTRAIFWLFGSTEEKAREWFAPIRAAGSECVAIARMPYEEYLEKVAEAAVGLQPVCLEHEFSRGKSFGKVLAYLNGQVANVASNNVDHPLFFRHGENGYIVENTVEHWAAAITKLLEDKQHREHVAVAGFRDFEQRFTYDVFGRLMGEVLTLAMQARARS